MRINKTSRRKGIRTMSIPKGGLGMKKTPIAARNVIKKPKYSTMPKKGGMF